ncbi:plasmid pRiA4b ORF-3 family protein [Alkalicoccobacillus porphyridii]|uniref:Plasmid pRiA4b ORF-3 family protein n=1 Tax=Alkalicoccobacillus porphyridii TaxID=2597270 RepID=A0A553ZW39_9BACI|nr:plasmid pRiA4b ORF-3 family protein [Alkalicoccobacillus porphyridii]TSB45555.1 plasmid pRiA4b ORF-3 family protein [Alkalicoccobacillus porphyridii]
MSERDYYQVKMTMSDIKPPIWRRVLVPSNITFHKFHKVIQAAFDWQDYHQYVFKFPEFLIIEPSLEVPLKEGDKHPKRTKIDTVFEEYDHFYYEYDLGDSWEHKIEVEKVVIVDEEKHTPICIDGDRNRPPEDVGGVPGYEEFLKTISDPTHEDYDFMLTWAEKDTGGRKFDPDYFYKNEINRRLNRIKC